jgi:aminoglycoside phosphotransferase (APT) family kinase protein
MDIGPVSELDETAILARVRAAAQTRWPGSAITGLTPLPGGVSSLTYRSTLTRPGAPDSGIVVKVAPPGLAPVRNRDVLRQSRVIALLDARPEMRMPSILFEDNGSPPLFVMTLMPGDSYEPLLDVTAEPPIPEVVARRARAAARMLASMHSFTPEELGVDDEPVVTLAEELNRWARLFDTVDDDICSGHRELYERLAQSLPATIPERLVHGDYRLANMLFDGSELTAVIDWEIWSVGDPRTDLAWLLMHSDPAHRFHEQRSVADETAGAAMPSADELAAAYIGAGGDAALLDSIDWFLAYCLYKTASTVSALVKRNRRRPDPDPTLIVAGRHLADIIARGTQAMTRFENRSVIR